MDRMELMQLAMPPERVRLLADAVERDMASRHMAGDHEQLKELHTWLKYRIARWEVTHPATKAS